MSHSPPTPSEQRLYLDSNRPVLYAFGLGSLALLIIGMILFLKGSPEASFFYLPFAAVIVFYLILSYAIGVFSRPFNVKSHLLRVATFSPMRLPDIYRPTVDIFYPTCGEDFVMQCETLHYLIDVQRAYGPNCKIYVLDDDPKSTGYKAFEKVAWRAGKQIEWFSRPNKGDLKKAGNLRYAFERTSGEYIAVFDADFRPNESFLEHTMAHMISDPKIGIVQTPQYFAVNDLHSTIEKGAAYVQELFYRLIQVNRDAFGAAICVGTNALYRRKALDPFGGSAPIPYSEDVRTGFNVMTLGYKVKYIPINMAKGRCPETMPQYFIQQYRWATGSISLFFNKEFWGSNLRPIQKACFLSGMLYYLTTGLGIFFIPLPSLYLLTFKPEMITYFNAVFSVPSFIFGTIYQAVWSRHKWGIYAMQARQLSYYSHLFALIDYVKKDLVSWQATGVATKTRPYAKFQGLCFWWTSLVTGYTLVMVFVHVPEMGLINFVPTLFFMSVNYYISMSLLRDQI